MLTAQIGRVLSTQGMGTAESLNPYPKKKGDPKFSEADAAKKKGKWGHEPKPNGRRRGQDEG